MILAYQMALASGVLAAQGCWVAAGLSYSAAVLIAVAERGYNTSHEER